MKKYELLLDVSKDIFGIKLFRIKALINFDFVKVGDLGGYIESEKVRDFLRKHYEITVDED